MELADNVLAKFTLEMKDLSQAMEVNVPFLPMHGVGEAKLFTRLVLELPVLMKTSWRSNGANM